MSNFSEEAIMSAMVHLENNRNSAKSLGFNTAVAEFNTDNWRLLSIAQIGQLIENNPQIKKIHKLKI